MKRHSRFSGAVSQEISEFIGSTKSGKISPQLRETAMLHLLDGLATMSRGAKEEPATASFAAAPTAQLPTPNLTLCPLAF